ncbi:hypothetical protein BKA56DRAFT_643878 [Ilyonectria sp. MPI-CAGE-AT-0026]|nr:hypothetical protein BKA56DRAFT_643878 [Ilyonectria sp. MPI-CAGE-AT-0026]
MIDTIQPSAGEYHDTYAASFRLWSGLRCQAQARPALHPYALSLSDAFPQHSRFLSNVEIKHAKYPRNSWAFVSGVSDWGSLCLGCQHGMPSFQQLVEITVSRKKPISLSIDQTNENYGYFKSWFPLQDQSYIPILMLGWAYVLSTRWIELISRKRSIAYTDIQAPKYHFIQANSPQHATVEIFIGSCSPEEARWWAAVLAPLLAPWSTSLSQVIDFALSSPQDLSSSPSIQSRAASSTEPTHGTQPQRIPQHQDLDRLLTLSCHVRDINSNLLGVFFEPALDVANPLLESDSWVLGQMFMEQLPDTAPLWLGATILGLQRNFIKEAGFGQIQVNLNAAAWSGTVQLFLLEPLSGRCHESRWISRADECRLLFLAQAEHHSQAPIFQWAPFGATAIEHTEIEVRIHKDCNGHTLQYDGFTWHCTNGESQLTQTVASLDIVSLHTDFEFIHCIK